MNLHLNLHLIGKQGQKHKFSNVTAIFSGANIKCQERYSCLSNNSLIPLRIIRPAQILVHNAIRSTCLFATRTHPPLLSPFLLYKLAEQHVQILAANWIRHSVDGSLINPFQFSLKYWRVCARPAHFGRAPWNCEISAISRSNRWSLFLLINGGQRGCLSHVFHESFKKPFLVCITELVVFPNEFFNFVFDRKNIGDEAKDAMDLVLWFDFSAPWISVLTNFSRFCLWIDFDLIWFYFTCFFFFSLNSIRYISWIFCSDKQFEMDVVLQFNHRIDFPGFWISFDFVSTSVVTGHVNESWREKNEFRTMVISVEIMMMVTGRWIERNIM